jgi:hypothetical protein
MTETLTELPPNIAVIKAGVVALTVAVVTMNVVLDRPVVMSTDAGTVAAATSLDRLMVVVLETAPLKLTVQVDVAGGVTVEGVQLKPESTGTDGWLMVTVAPSSLMLRELALPSDAAAVTSETSVEVSLVDGEIWNEMVATVPFSIAVVLMPEMTHRTSPGEMLLQSANFPAPMAAEPVPL